MESKKFNPYDWIEQKKDYKIDYSVKSANREISSLSDIEVIVQRVESYHLDLTLNYSDWLSIGFSFAASLGESGRQYYHRISRFNSKYNVQECNTQFDKCLARRKAGVSIKTFFYLAQSAGINISVKKNNQQCDHGKAH